MTNLKEWEQNTHKIKRSHRPKPNTLPLYYPIVILHTNPEIPRVPGPKTRDVDQKERDAVTTLPRYRPVSLFARIHSRKNKYHNRLQHVTTIWYDISNLTGWRMDTNEWVSDCCLMSSEYFFLPYHDEN